ncbi:SDR family oxidoreductase [Dactylosporangium sp. AC04546]|uniref:SDR family NAD(P)-dependent oxidoreductase n=1 Tax=Dactylosporangium sp. AC04546 TaxID=2862460 RepID=UPI001EDDDA3C|nr:SDR family oxidoreductase [Dactylosporangium sp. AC04546]WVK89875.1 SDR family oxidoreductase [Dactylosporangium sp. AC04546]
MAAVTERRTALITGATAGIGAAFVRELAAEGYDLVLVARDEARLAAMAAELPSAEVLPADLSTQEGCDAVAARLTDPARPVDLLVNNAGMSLNRSFLQSTAEQQEALLRLNVTAVMRLTLAALPAMTERGHGDIVNVSSVSGFAALMPGSTYPASKAWVTNFSESQAQLVRRFGVRVMALCPGYTRTEFHDRAGIDVSKTPSWMWLDAGAVVRAGLKDLRKGKLVSVPDWKYKLATFGMRHAPRSLVYRVSRGTRGRIGRETH